MALFPLADELSSLHDDVIAYASAIQNTIAAHGGCQSMSSEALDVIGYNAILVHRGVRALCEEGWTPLTPILNRTLLDLFASCIAVLNRQENADYMGFKYISDFYRKWLTDPGITHPEREEANNALAILVDKLPAADQDRGRELIREGRPRPYWFQPEYNTTRELLDQSPHEIHRIYKLFSNVTHGNFSARILFNDDPALPEINARQHPRNTRRAIAACSRLLLEVWYLRDQWDNHGVAAREYRNLLVRINALREV